jgi:hypothetical protein
MKITDKCTFPKGRTKKNTSKNLGQYRYHLGSSPTAKTKLLSFNRTQSEVVTGLLIGHNTLRRHLYLVGLINSPLCRRSGAEEETSAQVLCE